MKKFTTLFMMAIFAVVANAQTVLTQYDVPDEIKTASGVLYFKFMPIQYDSIAETPYTQAGDATICLSKAVIAAWGDYSCQIRTTKKSNNGYIDLRDQGNTNPKTAGNYLAEDTLRWDYNSAYHCWIDLNYSAMTYSVYVLKDGYKIADQKTIGTEAAFRNQVAELNYISIVSSNNFATDTITDIQVVASTSTLPVVEKPNTSVAGNQLSLSVFPTLVKDNLKVRYSNSATSGIKISICDITGKEVLTINSGNEGSGNFEKQIGTTRLNRGVYFIRLHKGNSTTVAKFIKE